MLQRITFCCSYTHVVAAANTIMSFNPQTSVHDLAKLIVVNYVCFPQTGSSENSPAADIETADGVYMYATDLLTLAVLWHGFHDSIKEGDGDRILRYWKFLLIIFKVTKHYNYAKETVNLLLQHHMMADRQKAQLLWSRCVNTRGVAGGNIPCDLHNEHLNRRLKVIVAGQGANVKPDSIVRAGKAIQCVQHICQAFEKQTATSIHSDKHNLPEFGKDFEEVMKVLEEEDVFVPSTRQHPSFNFKCGILQEQSHKQLLKKVDIKHLF